MKFMMYILCVALCILSQPQSVPARQTGELVEKLRSSKPEERERAIEALVKMGKEAVPALEQLANGPGAGAPAAYARHALRRIAISGSLPKKLKEALPELVERLQSPDPDEWTQAYLHEADTLVSAGTLNNADIEVLSAGAVFGASTVKDKKDACARAAKGSHRVAVPEIIRLIEDQDSAVWEAALRALDDLVAMEAAEVILSAMKSRDDDFKSVASRTYVLHRYYVGQWLPTFTKQLKDKDPEQRRQGAQGLGALFWHSRFPAGEKPLSLLVALMDDPEPEVSLAAFDALMRMGNAESGIGKLIQFLDQEHSLLRKGACRRLTTLGREYPSEARPALKEAPAKLIKVLEDKDGDVRPDAIRALGALQAREAIPLLKPLLKDADVTVRRAAADALMSLGVDPSKEETPPKK